MNTNEDSSELSLIQTPKFKWPLTNSEDSSKFDNECRVGSNNVHDRSIGRSSAGVCVMEGQEIVVVFLPRNIKFFHHPLHL